MNDTIETRWEQQNEAGRLSFTDGDYASAEQSFLAAIREATQLGPDNVRLASSLSNLGQLKYKQKDFAQAETLFHRALAVRERVLGPEHFGLVQNINNLAALHYARGELDQAEPLFQRALAISEQHLGEAHPDVAVTLNNLARLYFRRNEYAAAGPLLLRLLAIKEQALGARHPEVAAILTSLAKVRLHQQDYDGGEQFAERALAIRETLHLPNDLAVATALEMLAEINAARGRMDVELRHRERALAVREGAMGSDHPVVLAARAALQSRRAMAEGEMRPAAVASAPPMPIEPPPAPPAAAKLPVMSPPTIIVSPPPVRTTRSSSLPWIEAVEMPTFERGRPTTAPRNSGAHDTVAIPGRNGNRNGHGAHGAVAESRATESPLAFHPRTEELPARYAVPAVESRAPAAAIETHTAPHAPVSNPFTNSFARLVAETTPAGREAVVQDSPEPKTHDIADPRPEISLDWPIEPRRPWLKIALAVAALIVIAGGGWRYFSRRENTQALAAESVATQNQTGSPADTFAIRHQAGPLGVPASAVKPSAVTVSAPTKAGASTATPVARAGTAASESAPPASALKPDGSPASASPVEHASVKASDDEATSIKAPKLPTIKVDAITKMIDDSARHRADSVGNEVQQKEPTFKAKVYKAP